MLPWNGGYRLFSFYFRLNTCVLILYPLSGNLPMKKTLSIALLFAASVALYAQNGSKDKPAKKVTVPEMAVRWGKADTAASQSMSVRDFRKLMNDRIVPLEGGWQVKGFDFIYIEKRVYEDSAGNPLVINEYMSEFCPGDTISTGIRTLMPERVKSGDTAYISGIRLQQPNGKIANGKTQRYLLKR